MPKVLKGAWILAKLPDRIASYDVEKLAKLKAMVSPESLAAHPEMLDPSGLTTADEWRAMMWAAIKGDADDARSFVFQLPNPFRGWFALATHHFGTPNPVFRTIMEDVWDHDHHYLMHAVGQRRATVRAMMKRAAFDVSGLPETFPVYRGTSHLPLAKAAQGLAWTTSYDVAAWFAMRWGGPGPIVLRAQAKRSEAIFHHHGRNEDEVMLCRNFRPDEVAIIDGPEEWARRHAAHQVAKAAWTDEVMAA